MKNIVILLTLFLSGCVVVTETTTEDGFVIAYGKLQIDILQSNLPEEEINVSFADKDGNELPEIAQVRKPNGKVVVNIDQNWGREYGNTRECLLYGGDRFCRRQPNRLEFEEYIVVRSNGSPIRKYLISDLKNCNLSGLVCKNLGADGWVVTMDIAVVEY
ncbi:hypothetical protein [Microbulbifer variabilis]|uniref:hypothetical protein n=1 Tax=Microbulbifer variabilis TaxID=266805 RepID=UPI0003740878|nr:hypothetical protein [Microbulbifer variabilis]